LIGNSTQNPKSWDLIFNFLEFEVSPKTKEKKITLKKKEKRKRPKKKNI
jgi:hypothetical protein